MWNFIAVSLLAGLANSVALPASPAASSHSSSTSAAPTAGPSAPQYVHFNCDTSLQNATAPYVNTVNALHEAAKANDTAAQGKRDVVLSPRAEQGAAIQARAVSKISVDLYIHVVTTKANAGMVSLSQVNQQAAQMNADYNPHNIAFTLRNASFTVNDTWAQGATTADDLAMKAALRQGSYATLNLYLQSDLAGGVLGKCTLPTDVGASPAKSVYTIDGCNIAAGTVPGGPVYGYNMGKTAVHETGHWLGLLHTFEGYSCGGPGDYVTDTPAESQSTNGCPTAPPKNTCASARAGVDPIHNYMDYSTDACYSAFSAGQQARIMSLWPQFRQGK